MSRDDGRVDLRRQRDWISTLKPEGLVVSPAALVQAQAVLDHNVVARQEVLKALVGDVGAGAPASVDVVLPTAETPVREVRLRCVVRPDKAQADLLGRLGLRLPERLRLPQLPARM